MMAGTLYHHLCTLFLCIALFVTSVMPQEVTTTDALGETIVADITIDANGLPTTSIIQTLADTALSTGLTTSAAPTTSPLPTLTPTSTSSTATPIIVTPTTTTPDQVGPVGAPPTTTGVAGPTVYTYTTTNADGETVGVVDTFTPIYAPTVAFTPSSTGTILAFSSWLSQVGTNTAAADTVSGAQGLRVSGSLAGLSVGLVGVLTGAWVVLA